MAAAKKTAPKKAAVKTVSRKTTVTRTAVKQAVRKAELSPQQKAAITRRKNREKALRLEKEVELLGKAGSGTSRVASDKDYTDLQAVDGISGRPVQLLSVPVPPSEVEAHVVAHVWNGQEYVQMEQVTDFLKGKTKQSGLVRDGQDGPGLQNMASSMASKVAAPVRPPSDILGELNKILLSNTEEVDRINRLANRLRGSIPVELPMPPAEGGTLIETMENLLMYAIAQNSALNRTINNVTDLL